MNNFYTYSHSKPDGSIFYIGKGVGDRAFSKDNRNIHWKRTVNKYGYQVTILADWKTEEEAFEHEKFLISCFKDMGVKLVNLTPGGEGSAGYKWTKEQLANRRSIKGENNPMFGKSHSEETKRKIAEKAKGRKISEEAKAKISKAFKNREFSESHLEKLRLAGLGNKNGLGNKGKSKPCKIDNTVYASTLEASKVFGVASTTIQRRCLNPEYPNYQYI